jgi:hypothetical protein
MCCKLMAITELDKPRGTWCVHVRRGAGCAIYSGRPPSCASFDCGWLVWPDAGEHWFPLKSKMVIVFENDRFMAIHVDPSTPNVWKVAPYHDDIRRWARAVSARGQQIAVIVGHRTIMVFPDGEVDVGEVGDDEVVRTARLPDGSYTAEKVRAEDPRVTGHAKRAPSDNPRSPG